MGHADLVEVGKDETEIEMGGVKSAEDRMEFAANILTRLAYQRKNPVKIQGRGRKHDKWRQV